MSAAANTSTESTGPAASTVPTALETRESLTEFAQNYVKKGCHRNRVYSRLGCAHYCPYYGTRDQEELVNIGLGDGPLYGRPSRIVISKRAYKEGLHETFVDYHRSILICDEQRIPVEAREHKVVALAASRSKGFCVHTSDHQGDAHGYLFTWAEFAHKHGIKHTPEMLYLAHRALSWRIVADRINRLGLLVDKEFSAELDRIVTEALEFADEHVQDIQKQLQAQAE